MITRRNSLAGILAMAVGQQGIGFRNQVIPFFQAGNRTVINQFGEFIYNGLPAANNLVASFAPVGGTDPKGNVYLPDIVNYAFTGGQYQATQLANGVINFYVAATEAGPWTSLGTLSCLNGAVNGGMLLSVASNPGIITLQPFGTGSGNTVQVTQPVVFANAIDTPETWHNLGAPIAGWTVNGRARYKMLADSGLVLIELQNIALPGAPPADGTTIWTTANGLPAAYRPALASGRNPAYYNGGAGGEHPAWQFATDGSINVYGVGGTTVARMDLPYYLSPTI
jgi:hypothetical protein